MNKGKWFSFIKTKSSHTAEQIATSPRKNVPGARLIGSKASGLKRGRA